MDSESEKRDACRGDLDDQALACSSSRLLAMHWGDDSERIPMQSFHWRRAGVMIPWLIAGVLALLASLFVFNIVSRVLARPIPDVVAVSAENNEAGFYYTVWVKCTVRNNGGDGRIIVTATLEGGGTWALERVSYFAREEEKRLVLPFLGVTHLEEGISAYRYDCQVRPRGFRLGRNFY